MRLIDIEQGTADWHAWRLDGLGGSDAASAMNESPYANRQQLLREKLGMARREETFAMRRGSKLEPDARRLACLKLEKQFAPACVQHESVDWMRVSLDGIWLPDSCDKEPEILEIKCPSWQSHELALESVKFIPRVYQIQMQYQLLATGLDLCWYVSYSEHSKFPEWERVVIHEVHADAELQAAILEAAESFWSDYESARTPTMARAC